MSNGLFSNLGTGIATNNPLTIISDAIANYRSLFGTRMGPDGKIVPGEVDRAAQPLTSEWMAARTGADPESGAFMAGGLLSPGKAGPSALKIVTRASKVPGARKTWMGVDNIERANIDDRYAVLSEAVTKEGRLGDVFQHDALYKIYPGAKDVKVMPMPKAILKQQGDDTRAAFDKERNIIYVNPKLTKEQQESSIIHELTHYVQKNEGLVGGTNVPDVKSLAEGMKWEYLANKATDKKYAERIARHAKDTYGIDLEESIDNIATKLYRKQQGEGDAFAAQRAFEVQQSRRGKLTPDEYKKDLPVDPMYMYGSHIDKDNIFEDIFGYKMAVPTNEVDLGVSGTKNMRESTKDKMLKRMLPELY
jgi:hypothetical protein